MCITLTPTEVESEFIVVNLQDDNQLKQLRTVITYSNTTAPKINNDGPKNVAIGWFLPIYGHQLSDIKIYDLNLTIDKSVNNLLDFYKLTEETYIKSDIDISFDPSNESQTLTLQNGAQVIGAINPNHIMAQIANVNPAYHDQFLQTASKILNSIQETKIINCPCLIYLYQTDSARRNYLTYSVPFDKDKKVVLPTVTNNHSNLQLPVVDKRDIKILWGGQYNMEDAINIKPYCSPNNNSIPLYSYGMLSVEEHTENGWLTLDYGVQNTNNNNPYWDTEATSIIPLF